MILCPNRLPESERVCSGICTQVLEKMLEGEMDAQKEFCDRK